MATGEENTKRLYAASSYFASLETPNNAAFKERYAAMNAGRPPVLNALGQSLYEGIHFYASLRDPDRRDEDGPVRDRSARNGVILSNACKSMTIFLSRADGHDFHIVDKISG